MKAIIWGCGYIGQQLFREMQKSKNEIIGFADNNQNLNQRLQQGEKIFYIDKKIEHIYSIAEVENLYKQKKIDGVFIGTSDKYYSEIESQLNKTDIPVLQKRSINWVSAEEVCDQTYFLDNTLKVYVLSDMYLRTEYKSKGDIITYLYTEEGKVLIETFNKYEGVRDNRLLMQPLEFDEDNILEKVCVVSKNWANNYGHFVNETLDKLYLLEKCHFDGKYMILDSRFAREYVRLLGISEEKVIWTSGVEDAGMVYRVKELHCIEPTTHGLAGFKTAYALQEIANIIVKKLALEENRNNLYPQRIFIKRKTRTSPNMESICHQYGFVSIDPDELSLEEQIKYFYYADIVFSPHGANSFNSYIMRPNTHFIETFGRQYICPGCLDIMLLKHIKYHMIVERRLGIEPLESTRADYYIHDTLLHAVLQSVI